MFRSILLGAWPGDCAMPSIYCCWKQQVLVYSRSTCVLGCSIAWQHEGVHVVVLSQAPVHTQQIVKEVRSIGKAQTKWCKHCRTV